MSEIEKFLELMRMNRAKSPWSNERTFPEMVDQLEGEVHELRNENNPEEIRDELGDVLMDTFSLIAIAEEKGWFSADDLAQKAGEKLLRRKPWILEEHSLTPEEEVARWNAAKKKE